MKTIIAVLTCGALLALAPAALADGIDPQQAVDTIGQSVAHMRRRGPYAW